MNKKILIIGVVAVIIVAAIGAAVVLGNDGSKERTTVTEQGSDTMLELMTILAEDFHDSQGSVQVDVTGGGSGVGIEALTQGHIDVAQASRSIKASEMAAAQQNGVTPVEFAVAIDGIAIIVNQGNTVGSLTIEQLRGIYNGTYTNWNQVGGADMPISAFGRQSTSGTYDFVKEAVMEKGDFAPSVSPETGNAAITVKVQQTAGGIGYVGIGYAKQATSAKIVPLAEESGGASFLPTDETAVYNKSYPLSRSLFLYTDGTPSDAVKQWMEYVLSDEGQNTVAQEGFYKLDPATLQTMRDRLSA
ncbi:MAG: PstS family phosphate ABC transporter substrate-binding protein [Methanomassiliicoccus sp.]|nr:PstS family phosphate ABC transporter substrate-binding protein [Methanomassiliicoccus sp.]